MQSTIAMVDDRDGGAQPEPEGESAVRKGPWTLEEDLVLTNYVNAHGEGAWNSLARATGLNRTGKSCRLRWLNYLSPNVRRGSITAAEHEVIVKLHAVWGNKWSKIATHLPGRTDNEVKNYWRTRIQRKQPRKNQQAVVDWSGMATESTMFTAAGAGYLTNTPAEITEDQCSSNSGRKDEVTHQDYGTVVLQQPSICRLDDPPPQGYDVPGGGATGGAAMDDAPHPAGIMSDENFFWPLEDFWPMVQSFQSNCSLDAERRR